MTLLTVTAIYLVSLSVSAILLALGAAVESVWLMILGGILFVAGIVFELMMHRCPHCRSYTKLTWLSYCPHCGEEIRSDDKFFLRENSTSSKGK